MLLIRVRHDLISNHLFFDLASFTKLSVGVKLFLLIQISNPNRRYQAVSDPVLSFTESKISKNGSLIMH